MICRPSYWLLPVLSAACWSGMLFGMLIAWMVDTHREHYVSMDADQKVAYISDIGAAPRFKPVFIALCAVTTATLDLAFLADRWLRHAGRLTPNGSRFQKLLGILAIVFALAGTAGLVLLSVFDVAHHNRLHDGFLLLFLGGYVLSAVCICWEYQRLGAHHRDVRILRRSFWIKLAFVLVEVVMAIIFASLTFTHHSTGGAVVEWIIAFIFALYVLSFAIDLYPAVHSRRRARLRGAKHAREASSAGDASLAENGMAAGPAYANGDGPPAMEQVHGRYDGAYGESAARATRTPRSYNPINADVNADAEGSAANGLPLRQSEPAYEPARTYAS